MHMYRCQDHPHQGARTFSAYHEHRTWYIHGASHPWRIVAVPRALRLGTTPPRPLGHGDIPPPSYHGRQHPSVPHWLVKQAPPSSHLQTALRLHRKGSEGVEQQSSGDEQLLVVSGAPEPSAVGAGAA